MAQSNATPAFDARTYRGLGIWFDRAGQRGNYTGEYTISDEDGALRNYLETQSGPKTLWLWTCWLRTK